LLITLRTKKLASLKQGYNTYGTYSIDSVITVFATS